MLLLTGGTGFLGSFVLQELVERGFPVVCTYRDRRARVRGLPGVRWVRADLTRPWTLWRLRWSDEIDGIIHLASSLSFRYSTVIRGDVNPMRRVLSLWERGPFVFCSSSDVYGAVRRTPITEDHSLDPGDWYGLGKLVCEKMAGMAVEQRTDARLVIVRPPYILGPHPRFRGSLVGKLIQQAIAGDDFILPEGLAASGCSWVDARDLAEHIVTLATDGGDGTYNIASGFFTWDRLLELVIDLTGSSSRVILEKRGGCFPDLSHEERRLSVDRLASIRELSPRSIDESLRDILAGFR